MTLSREMQQAAQELGAALRQHETIQQYLQAAEALRADPAASALDSRFETMRADLVARQRAGENLPDAEVQAFYALQAEVAGNPLIENRDNALMMAKGYLANVGMDLKQALELDFVRIASA
jgi:cell fate (sporulation/competence/biofilm development) regulator YlbF (YheA/YmcA/DUF963 family)